MARVLRYFFVGGVAAAVDLTIFAVFAQLLGLPWFPVAAGSFVVATLLNYILSIKIVFKSRIRFSRLQEAALVFVVSALGLTINQCVLWVLIEVLFLQILLAKVVATGAVFFWNYGLRYSYIFREAV